MNGFRYSAQGAGGKFLLSSDFTLLKGQKETSDPLNKCLNMTILLSKMLHLLFTGIISAKKIGESKAWQSPQLTKWGETRPLPWL